VHSGAFRVQNIDALFFMLRWARCGFHKKHTGTRYAELVFLHLVGSVGHVLDSDASATQNVIALFVKLGWDRFGFDKKCTGIRYAELVFLHPVASVGGVVHSDASRACILLHYFSCSGGPGVVSIKNPLGHVALILCFCIR
jgi:hypothetical protein